MEIALLIGKFIIGLLLIVKGADWLTDGASSIARKFNISTLVIGLTIVAFGTSAPELVVSSMAAVSGETDIAIGNVVGSNIFNTLAIMGVTAMIAPVPVKKNNIRYEVPLAIIASVAIFVMANDVLQNGDVSNLISRGEGIILLCFFGIFLAYTFAIARNGVDTNNSSEDTNVKVMPVWKSILLFLVGLGCLVFGGDTMVDGASGIAGFLGVSQSVIALTIVSAGTSFPELVTSVVAARKGDTDMAMGNVVGSNIFNIFLILGTAATINPLGGGNITMVDYGMLLFSAVVLWTSCTWGKEYHKVTRTEGAMLTLCMIAYYVYIVYNA
jgi:cation:H+ antiporter